MFPSNPSQTQQTALNGNINHIGWLGYRRWKNQSTLNLYRNYAIYKRFLPATALFPTIPTTAKGQSEATASIFTALMLNRNGPWGWPTWKQIRVSDNPLTRKQKTENILTIVDDTALPRTRKINNRFVTFTRKFGNIKSYNENAIHYSTPLQIDAGSYD